MLLEGAGALAAAALARGLAAAARRCTVFLAGDPRVLSVLVLALAARPGRASLLFPKKSLRPTAPTTATAAATPTPTIRPEPPLRAAAVPLGAIFFASGGVAACTSSGSSEYSESLIDVRANAQSTMMVFPPLMD